MHAVVTPESAAASTVPRVPLGSHRRASRKPTNMSEFIRTAFASGAPRPRVKAEAPWSRSMREVAVNAEIPVVC